MKHRVLITINSGGSAAVQCSVGTRKVVAVQTPLDLLFYFLPKRIRDRKNSLLKLISIILINFSYFDKLLTFFQENLSFLEKNVPPSASRPPRMRASSAATHKLRDSSSRSRVFYYSNFIFALVFVSIFAVNIFLISGLEAPRVYTR
jgi:hypothetical protein